MLAVRSPRYCHSLQRNRLNFTCRRLSAATDVGKKFSDTLSLPLTEFPLRPAHENGQRYNDGAALYAWQRQRSQSTVSEYVLLDGPPFANGDLHVGHALNKILKDIIVRRKVLEGRTVRYVPGWDCHGLPIELKALQRQIGSTSDKHALESARDLSPSKVRQVAENLALETIDIQSSQFQQFSICADWQNPYRTLDLPYEVAQLKVFADMVTKDLIYRADKPVYWSPSSRTALAEGELEYNENHISHSVYVGYDMSKSWKERFPGISLDQIQLLIWTTTAWTLPANRAIAVNPALRYSFVSFEGATEGRNYVIATELIKKMEQYLGTSHIEIGYCNGSELVGLYYKDVFDGSEKPILEAQYVSAESGTGLVHTAPGHGHEDYLLCKQQSSPIPVFSPVDDAGNYTDKVPIKALIGLNVQGSGSKKVIEILQQSDHLVAVEKYKHKYPYDWRTKQPIIVRSTPQFFADLSPLRNQALNSLEKVLMIPESGKARLKAFTISRDEWCISRQRSWGVPIPVLYDEFGGMLLDRESIDHIIGVLQERGTHAWFTPDSGEDDWKAWVPEKYRSEDKWIRGRETLDVWFDSGCAWTTLIQGQSKEEDIIADLYLEGSDQHRGWFQSSLLTAIANKGKAPYKQVITHGFVLDDKGRKMSKSLGNVVEPLLVINGRKARTPDSVDSTVKDKATRKRLERIARETAAEIKPLGLDTLRLWVAQSDYTADVSFSHAILAHVAEALRKYRSTIRYMIGNLQDYKPDATISEDHPYQAIDAYAQATSRKFRTENEAHFQSYSFNKVVTNLNQYTNAFLSAFYFDTLKDRLYADGKASASRRSAQATLHVILRDYLMTLAPICPALLAEVWQHVPSGIRKDFEHVYDTDWYAARQAFDNDDRELIEDWGPMMKLRDQVNKELAQARTQKLITSSLQACVELTVPSASQLMVPEEGLANFFIVSDLRLSSEGETTKVVIRKADKAKCPRCWVHAAPSETSLCSRCSKVIL